MLIFLYDVIIKDFNVTSSMSKTFMKFWGACFKFWLRLFLFIFLSLLEIINFFRDLK